MYSRLNAYSCQRACACAPVEQLHVKGRMEIAVNRLHYRLLWLLRSEEGPTATEYAVMLAVISATVLAAMSQFGEHMDNLYTIINGSVDVF